MPRTIRWKAVIHQNNGKTEEIPFENLGQAVDFVNEDTSYYEDTSRLITIERCYNSAPIEAEELCEEILTPMTS